ncbi:MAG: hypothetical protein FH748_03255 [Balneolaceae bacterium]|nr:hypothetical protein [Balneolaceae bacterium]
MLKKIYTTSKGLTSNKIVNKYIFGILLVSYALIYLYIAAYFRITWTELKTPGTIIFDGRNIGITMYSNTLAVLLYVVFAIKIYWLNMQSEVFFNKTSMRIFYVNNVSGTKLYFHFFIKRVIELFLIDVIVVISFTLIYLIGDHVLVLSLLTQISTLFISSLILLTIYDVIFHISLKSTSSSLITLFIIAVISLINFAIRPVIGHSNYAELANLLPDLLSISYNYLLMSFDVSYSSKQVYYPLFFFALGVLYLYRSSDSMLLRFSNNS